MNERGYCLINGHRGNGVSCDLCNKCFHKFFKTGELSMLCDRCGKIIEGTDDASEAKDYMLKWMKGWTISKEKLKELYDNRIRYMDTSDGKEELVDLIDDMGDEYCKEYGKTRISDLIDEMDELDTNECINPDASHAFAMNTNNKWRCVYCGSLMVGEDSDEE